MLTLLSFNVESPLYTVVYRPSWSEDFFDQPFLSIKIHWTVLLLNSGALICIFRQRVILGAFLFGFSVLQILCVVSDTCHWPYRVYHLCFVCYILIASSQVPNNITRSFRNFALNLIYNCQYILNKFYDIWSYVYNQIYFDKFHYKLCAFYF